MKDFAMYVWEMPKDEFLSYAMVGVFVALIVYEMFAEISARRVIRQHKKFQKEIR